MSPLFVTFAHGILCVVCSVQAEDLVDDGRRRGGVCPRPHILVLHQHVGRQPLNIHLGGLNMAGVRTSVQGKLRGVPSQRCCWENPWSCSLALDSSRLVWSLTNAGIETRKEKVNVGKLLLLCSWRQYYSHILKTNNKLTKFSSWLDEIRKSIFTCYIFMCFGSELKSPTNGEGRKVTREWRPETESHHNSKSNTLSIILLLLSNCIVKCWSKGTIKNKGKVMTLCSMHPSHPGTMADRSRVLYNQTGHTVQRKY